MSQKPIIICIDPGHGGDINGEAHVFSGKPTYEKTFNLEIAQLIETELRNYENVEIVLTRREDVDFSTKERIQYAIDHRADYLISLHANALSDPDKKITGSMVIVAGTHYQPENARVNICDITNKMGLSITSKLNNLGVPIAKEAKNGIIRRVYQHKKGEKNKASYYDDGSAADLYATMRLGIQAGIPTIIIKHSYMSTEEDCQKYLSTWKDLENLAKADAEGIVEALHLKKKDPRTAPNVLSYI